MTRVIKFRAYIKDEKKMLFSPSLDSNDLADRSMADFWKICEDFTTYKDDVIAMQYTGFKDKNGKEVFEGDIVAFTDDKLRNRAEAHGGPKKNRLIKWKKNGYNLKFIEGDMARGIEVIGNIYENPELLEAK